MDKEKRIEKIRQLLREAKEKERDWKKTIEQIIQLSAGLKDHQINLIDYTICEIDRCGGA